MVEKPSKSLKIPCQEGLNHMNNTEFYERLGVDKNASQDEIKKLIERCLKVSPRY